MELLRDIRLAARNLRASLVYAAAAALTLALAISQRSGCWPNGAIDSGVG